MHINILRAAVENKSLILTILKMCNKSISSLAPKADNCGLFNGLAGDLLFLYRLSQLNVQEMTTPSLEKGVIVDESVFNEKLEYLQLECEKHIKNYGLSKGLSGLGWFLEYINQNEDYDSEFCSDIDSILVKHLSVDDWDNEIEMVMGIGSIAVYSARRGLKSNNYSICEKLIHHYEKLSIKTGDDSLTWSQPAHSYYRFNKLEPETLEFNLGLAHGVPGIIAAIIPILSVPQLHERAKVLITQGCNWLLRQELRQSLRTSYFSTSCSRKDGARLGWCYGDLTIALTLARVGNALNIPSYLEKAKEISLFSAEKNSQKSMLNDAGLCHGSAGLALIFQLLHKQLNEPKLLEAANHWLLFTLNLYKTRGKEGLYMYSGITKGYEENTGLLMGYGGIGLCLLSALNGETDWVDCLLLA